MASRHHHHPHDHPRGSEGPITAADLWGEPDELSLESSIALLKQCQGGDVSSSPSDRRVSITMDELRTILAVISLVFGIDAQARIDTVAGALGIPGAR